MEKEYIHRLQEVINREDLKLNDKGFVVWRSGMDATGDPIVNDNTHISDLFREWFEYNEKQRLENMTEMEKSMAQQTFPLTPDDAKRDLEYIDLRKEELQKLIDDFKVSRRQTIDEEYG